MADYENGFIKLHRTFLRWEWNDSPSMVTVFIHCLLLANWKDARWHGKIIERGSFITSYSKLAATCGVSVVTCRKCLAKLSETGEISMLVNRSGICIKVHNYAVFQDVKESDMPTKVYNKVYAKVSDEVYNKVYTTKEEKEEKEMKNIINNIVSFLNETAGTSFKPTSAKTRSLITARLREGFTEEDFKKVIEIKTAEWKNTTMEKYLRPVTIFGTKFESYLNQPKPQSIPEWYTSEPVRNTEPVPATAEEIEATRNLIMKGVKQ